MKPVVDRAALVAARVRRGLTIEELAERAGYSARAIAAIELGESGGRARTLRDVARVLGVPVSDILRAPAVAAPPPRELPAPTASLARLDKQARESLRQLEVSLPEEPPLTVGGVVAPHLSVGRFEILVSSYKRHVGKLFWTNARLAQIHGVPDEEAAPLGSENGVAVRYLATALVAGQHELPITVHALDPKVVDRVQELSLGTLARLVLQVRVPGGLVVSWYGYEQKRPFALELVDFVVPRRARR